MLTINSVANFRDVAIGSKMKTNLLFRCAKLSTLNQEDIINLETLNPFAIIDFRDPKEINKAPNNLSKTLPVSYTHLTLPTKRIV